MYLLDPRHIRFPPPERATPEGLLAVGGDLSRERLLAAYRAGIFPWFSEGDPLLWWSPDPRALFPLPGGVRVRRSLAKRIRNGGFRISADTCFEAVMRGCAAPRRDGGDTWILPEMVAAYTDLHAAGHAHSIEVWHQGRLAGGLYGVAVGAAFCGESMFSRVRDASKAALVCLAEQLGRWGFHFIDAQIPTPHLASLGAVAVPRAEFLARLERAVAEPGRPGPWRLDPDLPLPLAAGVSPRRGGCT